MKKKANKNSITIFIPISQLDAIWTGEFKNLPANQTFQLIIDYPLGGERPVPYNIKTGKTGMGLVKLLKKIGEAYVDLYTHADRYGVFGHDMEDLQLEGINVDFKKKIIRLDVGS